MQVGPAAPLRRPSPAGVANQEARPCMTGAARSPVCTGLRSHQPSQLAEALQVEYVAEVT